MKIGDTVACVKDFSKLGRTWNTVYPKLYSVLTISRVEEHPCEDVAEKGIKLLYFKELPNLHGMCDRDVRGKDNFIVCELPTFVKDLLK